MTDQCNCILDYKHMFLKASAGLAKAKQRRTKSNAQLHMKDQCIFTCQIYSVNIISEIIDFPWFIFL